MTSIFIFSRIRIKRGSRTWVILHRTFFDLYNLSCTYSFVNICNTDGTTRAKIVVGDDMNAFTLFRVRRKERESEILNLAYGVARLEFSVNRLGIASRSIIARTLRLHRKNRFDVAYNLDLRCDCRLFRIHSLQMCLKKKKERINKLRQYHYFCDSRRQLFRYDSTGRTKKCAAVEIL